MTERDRRIIEAMIGEADDWHIVDPETGAEIDQDGGIPVTPGQFKSLLAGGSAVVGLTRRVVTLADGPFSIRQTQVLLVEEGGPGSGFKGHKGRPGEVGGSLPTGIPVDILRGFPIEDFEKPRDIPSEPAPKKTDLDLDDKAFGWEDEDIAVQLGPEEGIFAVVGDLQAREETAAAVPEPALVPEIYPAIVPEELPVEPELKSTIEDIPSSAPDLELASIAEVSEETTDTAMPSGDVKGLLARLIDLVEKIMGWTPVVNLTIPEQQVPVVHVYLPEQPAPIVNLTLPEEKTPEVHFHAPEQPAPIVNLTLPDSASAPTPNIIVQPAPVTVIQSPMAKLLRRHGVHRLTRDGGKGVVTGNEVEEEYEYEGDGDVQQGQ